MTSVASRVVIEIVRGPLDGLRLTTGDDPGNGGSPGGISLPGYHGLRRLDLSLEAAGEDRVSIHAAPSVEVNGAASGTARVGDIVTAGELEFAIIAVVDPSPAVALGETRREEPAPVTSVDRFTCPTCGQPNAPEAPWCGACGRDL